MNGISKKAELTTEQIIFLVLNLLFFVLIFFFVWRAGNSLSAYEEFYAKKIGLALNELELNTEVHLSLKPLYDKMRRGTEKELIIEVKEGKLFLRASKNSKGFEYNLLRSIPMDLIIDPENKILIIKT